MMKMFVLMILSAYLSLWHEMSRIEWKAKRVNDQIDLNYPSLQKNSLSNKIICFSLKKKNGECQYAYYAKRVIVLMAILLMPWFVCVYIYEWYSVKQVLILHLVMLIIVISAPTNVFHMIWGAYENKKHM